MYFIEVSRHFKFAQLLPLQVHPHDLKQPRSCLNQLANNSTTSLPSTRTQSINRNAALIPSHVKWNIASERIMQGAEIELQLRL